MFASSFFQFFVYVVAFKEFHDFLFEGLVVFLVDFKVGYSSIKAFEQAWAGVSQEKPVPPPSGHATRCRASGAGKKVLDIMKVKPGAVITDVARPLDLSAEDVAKRPDVLVIESGEIELPGDPQMKGIGLPKGVAYACLAETIVLALEGRYETFTVGRNIEWEKVKEIYRLGLKHGMKLAAISGVNGVYTDSDLGKIRELALGQTGGHGPDGTGLSPHVPGAKVAREGFGHRVMPMAAPAPPNPAPPNPAVSYRSWLPRLTSRVLLDLRIWMMGFGLLIGVVFPFAVVPLGVPHDVAIRPAFAATILAGLLVGAINTALVQMVVGIRLRALAASMRRVEVAIREATELGDWSSCDPGSCRIRSTPPTSSASPPSPSTSSSRAWQPVTG